MRRRVAVVDEHEVFRRGVVALLDEDPNVTVVLAEADGPVPDETHVIVASPRAFRTMSGERRPALVCWGPYDPPLIHDATRPVAILERDLAAGEELVSAVRALAAGLRLEGNRTDGGRNGHKLDGRRRHVLSLLAEGADTRRISASLCYSERTIKSLISDIETELDAATRAEAVAKGIRLGLI